MPTAVGPNTKGEENLVFGYDLGDVSNSYKGEPTVNLIGSFVSYYNNEQYWNRATSYFQVSVVAEHVVDVTAPGGAYTHVRANNTSTNSQIFWSAASIGTISEFGQPVTVTAWLKGSGQVKLNAYDNITGYKQGPSIILTDEWIPYSFSTTFGSGSGAANHWVGVREITSGSDGIDEVYVSKVQWERNSHATPYVKGTRSATQGLIDLTGNSTINLTNVSFDSNAQITFDGTDDRVAISPRRQFAITDPWTTELVFKPTDGSDTSWNGLFGGLLSQGGYWMFHSVGNLTYYEGSNAEFGTRITYRTWTKANTFTTDDYHHLTIAYTPLSSTQGSFTLYYNGGEKTDTFTWTFSWSHSLDIQNVGAGDGRYGTNDVHYFKQYDRTLTASEIKANYNAIKGRFNI